MSVQFGMFEHYWDLVLVGLYEKDNKMLTWADQYQKLKTIFREST